MMADEFCSAPVPGAYTDREWRLVTSIMDQVDRLRENEPAVPDLGKVIALVEKTYQDQQVPVPERLLKQAVALALSAFPAPSPSRLETLPNPAPHWTDRLFGTAAPEPVTLEQTPLQKANALILRLQAHGPLTNDELARLIAHRREKLTAQKRTQVKPWLGRALASLVTTPLASGVAFSFSFTTGLVTAVVGVCSVVGFTAAFFNARSDVYRDELNILRWGEEAFANQKWGDAWLTQVISPALGSAWNDYNCAPLQEGSHESTWEYASKVASADPLLAEVWARWLASDKPIRSGDITLLCNTAQAMRDAKTWLAFQNEVAFPAIRQAKVRTRALEAMSNHRPAARLPAPVITR